MADQHQPRQRYVSAMNLVKDPEAGFYNSSHAGTHAVGPRRGLISFATPHTHIVMRKYREMGFDHMPIALVFGVPPAFEIMTNFSGLHMDLWGRSRWLAPSWIGTSSNRTRIGTLYSFGRAPEDSGRCTSAMAGWPKGSGRISPSRRTSSSSGRHTSAPGVGSGSHLACATNCGARDRYRPCAVSRWPRLRVYFGGPDR